MVLFGVFSNVAVEKIYKWRAGFTVLMGQSCAIYKIRTDFSARHGSLPESDIPSGKLT